MAAYEDPSAPAEVWRITGEQRTRKQLSKLEPKVTDPKLRPSTDRTKYHRN